MDAVRARKMMLERKFVTASPLCRAAIVKDIESCRRLLVKINRNFGRLRMAEEARS